MTPSASANSPVSLTRSSSPSVGLVSTSRNARTFTPRRSAGPTSSACIWLSTWLRRGVDSSGAPLMYNRHSDPAKPSTSRSTRSGTCSATNVARYQTANGYAAAGSSGCWYSHAPGTTVSQSFTSASGAAYAGTASGAASAGTASGAASAPSSATPSARVRSSPSTSPLPSGAANAHSPSSARGGPGSPAAALNDRDS